ncbi:MAG: preprotein translocase subunit SecY [Clostridia bacterium]|nr:preprotein translocase subunit SecY [Clostridia bacterium]
MLQTLKNAWNTKEIRSKILFTLLILLLYRVGTVIPVPFVEANDFAQSLGGTILEYMNILSGGSLGALTLFALGVQPYINASIIIQLLAVVFPKLGELAKTDKKKMNFITRIVTVILAVVTAVGYYFLLKNGGYLTNAALESNMAWLYAIVIIVCYVAGASVIMWLAERINEKGIGNGISLILFANIVAEVPSVGYTLGAFVVDTYGYSDSAWLYAGVSTLFAVLLIAVLLALVAVVIWFTGSERRIPVQYAKKVVGRKMYGGQNSSLPIKLNMTGVMPIIFASSIVTFLPTVFQILESAGAFKNNPDSGWLVFADIIGQNGVVFPILMFVLVIAFAYFYAQITFDPIEVANNLKKQGGAIPGIRQGRPTSDYIRKILNKITLAGALFLALIAVLPNILGPHVLQYFFEWIYKGAYPGMSADSYIFAGGGIMTVGQYATQMASGLVSKFSFGGTTLLIVVGVAIETYRELEAQLTMRNYKGFLN